MTTHYETLGVPADASAAEIKAAYRRAALRAHPDREGGDAEGMQRVNEAYRVLGDPELRKRYDAGDLASAPQADPEQEFRNEIRRRLGEALNSLLDESKDIRFNSVTSLARSTVERQRLETQNAMKVIERGLVKIANIRKSVTFSGEGTDLLAEVLDGQEAAGRSALENAGKVLKELDRIVEALKAWKEEVEAPQDMAPGSVFLRNNSSGFFP